MVGLYAAEASAESKIFFALVADKLAQEKLHATTLSSYQSRDFHDPQIEHTKLDVIVTHGAESARRFIAESSFTSVHIQPLASHAIPFHVAVGISDADKAQLDIPQAQLERTTFLFTPPEQYVESLLFFFSFIPFIKKITLIIDHNDSVMQSAGKLCFEKLSPGRTITMLTHEETMLSETNSNRNNRNLEDSIEGSDAVILLSRSFSQKYYHQLNMKCLEQKVLLYCTDMSVSQTTSGVCSGPEILDMVAFATKAVSHAFTTGSLPPSTEVAYHFSLNREVLANQGIFLAHLSPFISLIDSVEVRHSDQRERLAAYYRLTHLPLD